MEFWSLYRIIRKRLWMVVFLVLVTVTSTVVTVLGQPETFKASATIRVAVTSPSVADVGRLDWYTAGILFSTVQETILSRSILQEVIDENFLGVTPDDLRKAIGVSRIGNSNLLRIDVKSTDPEMSKKLANDIAATFIRYNQKLLDTQSASSIAFYEEQAKLAEQNYNTAREDFRNSLNQPNARAAENQFIAAQQAYHAALDKLDAARLLNRFPDLRPSSVAISEPAVTPTEPEGRQLSRYTLIALLVSLIIGVFIALGIEYLDFSIRSPYEVTSQLGLAVLGMIPHFKSGVSGVASVVANLELPIVSRFMRWRINSQESSIVPPERMSVRSLESIGKVRLNIVASHRRRVQEGGRKATIIVITSSRPRDGKTTLTANLGVALARGSYRVLIVDGDLRKPQLHDHLGVDLEGPGLSDVLAGNIPFERAIRKTKNPNLWIVTAGSPTDNPADLLDSDRLSELVGKASGLFDFILFDSPSLGLYTDAAMLAAHLGRVLMVIDAAKLSVENEARSLGLLTATGASVEGVVINKVNPEYVDPIKLHEMPRYLANEIRLEGNGSSNGHRFGTKQNIVNVR